MSKVQILFVDDEKNILNGLRLVLRSMRNEWDLDFALGGEDALKLMDGKHYDVIVSDMRMPGMDGAQLLAEVAVRSPETVRIILSGYSDQATVLRTVKLAHQYLSKPCSHDDLKSAISRSLHLRGVINSTAITQVVSRVDALPALPKLYLELMDALQDVNSSLEDIGDIISKDVGMSSNILRLVNSAFFGLPTHISSAGHAARLLGVDTIRALVLSIHLFSRHESDKLSGLSLSRLWMHSARVACFSQAIAELEKQPATVRDDCFIAGTLHDVGTLVLATSMPKVYAEVIARAKADNRPLHDVEREAFLTTHAEVGAYLLSLWGFKDSVTEAVCWHHEPSRINCEVFSPLLAVAAANVFDNTLSSDMMDKDCFGEDVPCLTKGDYVDKLETWREHCLELNVEDGSKWVG